jgi:transposase ISL3 family protein
MRGRYSVARSLGRGWTPPIERWSPAGSASWRIQSEIRRVDCRGCEQVRTEWMPWARPGARHTRDFEDMAAWLVKRMSKAGAAMLLRTTWHTIDTLVRRLVDEHLDSERLDGMYRIGVHVDAIGGQLHRYGPPDTGRRSRHQRGALARIEVTLLSHDLFPLLRRARDSVRWAWLVLRVNLWRGGAGPAAPVRLRLPRAARNAVRKRVVV